MQSMESWISTLAPRLQPAMLIGAGEARLAEALSSASIALPDVWLQALTSAADPGEVVEQIWSPLHDRARGWVTRLATITEGFGLVIGTNDPIAPRLVYLSRWGGEVHGWLGGMPVEQAEIANCEQRLGQALPASLRRFVQIHNGLLENGFVAAGFSPLADLQPLPDHPELLPFFGDGYGDRQCFDRSAPVGHGDFLTVTWDHELNTTRRPQSFWAFLKELTVRGFG